MNGINEEDIRILSCPEKNCGWASDPYHMDSQEFAQSRYQRHYLSVHLPEPKEYPVS